jgi:hypothetical protein
MDLIGILGMIFIGLFLIIMILWVVFDRKGMHGKLREISAFSNLNHQIGLAVEAGQRLHLSLGHGGVFGWHSGSAFVGLSMLKRVAQIASIADRPPIATSGEAVEAILSQDTLHASYQLSGQEHHYSQLDGQVSGLTPFSFTVGMIPVIYDQNVSTHILSGSFGGEVAVISEAIRRNSSSIIAGSDSLPAQAILYSFTDRLLIGEELYAGGAYLQAGDFHTASLKTQDIFRWIIVIIIGVGSMLKLVGIL